MHKPESILENEMHKKLWIFEVQMNHLIPARRPDLVVINKKKRTCSLVDFDVLADHSENKRKRKNIQILRPSQRFKKKL